MVCNCGQINKEAQEVYLRNALVILALLWPVLAVLTKLLLMI